MFKRILGAACLMMMPLAMLAPNLRAADHRDAPGVDGAGEGDITDVFAFLSPNDKGRLVLAMGVNPFAVAASPGTYRFSTDFLYQFKLDRSGTFKEDYVIQIRFANTPTGQHAYVVGGAPDVTGAINQPLSSPDYASDADVGGVWGDPGGVLVFTGLRDDPFVFDVGQFNRIMAGTQDVFRDLPTTPLGPLRGRPVGSNGASGIDSFGGFNASFIVVELPVSMINVTKMMNVWATVSAPSGELGGFVQFERMGQPAFNTVFIPKPMKDAFNQGVPSDDMARWAGFVPDSLTTTDNDTTGNTISGRAGLLSTLGLDKAGVGAPLLLPASFANTNKNLLRVALLPDVLRIDVTRDWNDLGIGAFGLTNGRRPADDSIDIALRLLRQLADVNLPAALKVPGSGAARAGALTLGDPRVTAVLQGTDFIRADAGLADVSVSGNDAAFLTSFPYLAPPNPIPGDTPATSVTQSGEPQVKVNVTPPNEQR